VRKLYFSQDVKGNVNYNGVNFTYPTRPNAPVLKGLDLAIKPGQTIALVGPSGCGKSTCIQLLERFYDPISGSVVSRERERERENAAGGWFCFAERRAGGRNCARVQKTKHN